MNDTFPDKLRHSLNQLDDQDPNNRFIAAKELAYLGSQIGHQSWNRYQYHSAATERVVEKDNSNWVTVGEQPSSIFSPLAKLYYCLQMERDELTRRALLSAFESWMKGALNEWISYLAEQSFQPSEERLQLPAINYLAEFGGMSVAAYLQKVGEKNWDDWQVNREALDALAYLFRQHHSQEETYTSILNFIKDFGDVKDPSFVQRYAKTLALDLDIASGKVSQ